MADVPLSNLNELEELKSMLSERVKHWTQEWKHQGWLEGMQEGQLKGIQEGQQKGRQAGEAALLMRQLERRFGPLAPEAKSRITNADAETLLIWGDRVLTANTVEQIFQD